MGQSSRRKKGKSSSRSSTPTPPESSVRDAAGGGGIVEDNDDDKLVLTSEKRRGIYECDYCHSDISQQPRIRCAVCSDFDLCLDCFTTSDHGAMMARIKAATDLGEAVVSSAAVHHEDTHCYRVCDSTRYPVFPQGRVDSSSSTSSVVELSDDPKTIWTAEEDLRLIDAIGTHGLGNWVDIAEAIGGQGSVGKTPKRCMERYLDDYLGRYGHVLPPWTIVDDSDASQETMEAASDQQDESGKTSESESVSLPLEPTNTSEVAPSSTTTTTTPRSILDEEDRVRTSKRRSTAANGSSSSSSRKKVRVLSTESLSDSIWPDPYMPEGVVLGEEVARDQSCKAELAFVKATMAASTKAEADAIRQHWIDTKLGGVGAPTVLPPRPHDAVHLLGSELAGFMPRRGDFDVEWENDAEAALADMEFIRGDRPEDKELKLKVLQIYCEKLDEREKRKKFVLHRHLYDYRTYVQNDAKLPADERDLVHRMRLFERFHTPDEHKKFLQDILKAKRLRKEIAKLQMYRRIGIRSLAEAEAYELDKDRRQFHKKLEIETKAKMKSAVVPSTTAAAAAATQSLTSRTPVVFQGTDSLWKQYRTNDRKNRRKSGSTVEESTIGNDKPEGSAAGAAGEGVSETVTGEETVGNEPTTETATPKEATTSKETTTTAEEKPPESETETPSDKPPQGTGNDPIDVDNFQEPIKEDDANYPEFDLSRDANYPEFDLSRARCRDLLSKKELALCERLEIYPVPYLEIKKVLIHESLENGLLDKDSTKRTILKIDIERRGNIVDFLVRAGWINRRLGEAAIRVVTPQPL